MDENGLSPVIGVIFMVTATVIIAAVIAQFVFSMSANISKGNAPSSDYQTVYNITNKFTSSENPPSYLIQIDKGGSTTIYMIDYHAGKTLYDNITVGKPYLLTYHYAGQFPLITDAKEV